MGCFGENSQYVETLRSSWISLAPVNMMRWTDAVQFRNVPSDMLDFPGLH